MRLPRGILVILLLGLCTFLRPVHAQEYTPVAADFQRSHPHAQGLVAYLPILPHTAGGRTWWSPLQRLHGTLVNSPLWRSSAVSSWYGEVQCIAGTPQYVDLGTAPTLDFPDQAFTVSLDVTRGSATGAPAYLVAKRLASGTSGGYFIRVATDGTITVRLLDASSNAVVNVTSAATTLLAGTPYTITAVFRTDTSTAANNAADLYLNGALAGSATGAGNPYAPCPTCAFRLCTASDDPPTNGANLSLGRLMVWNRGLSAAAIARVAQQTGPVASGLFIPYSYELGVILNPRRNISGD